MFAKDAYTLLVQLLSPKYRYIVNDKSLLSMDGAQDIYAHNIKSPRKRQENKFLTCPVPEFNVGDNVLVRNHTRYMWHQKFYVAYHIV